MQKDILIINANLLSMAQDSTVCIPHCFIRVRDGLIAEMGDMAELFDSGLAGHLIDARDCLLMPGLVNCHNHCAMTLFRGLADDLPLMTWLECHIFPAEARFVSEEMVYWSTRLAAAEMILSGTTTVANGYFFEDAAARVFRETGLRAVAGHGIIDFPAPGVPDPAQNVRVVEEFIGRWQDDERVRPAVFCHSPYTCGPKTLQKAKDLARLKGVDFFIHLAETRAEVEEIRKLYSVSPVKHLSQLGILDRGTVCVHCVWLSEEDLDILQESGARVVTCPASNMKLGSGIAPLPAMRDRNIEVGLGTDGCASNNNLDLFMEMDLCAKLHKVERFDPAVMPAKSILQMATIGGARTLGLDRMVGSLEVGKRADLIMIDVYKPHLTPFYNEDILVYAAKGGDVRTVIVDGRLVMLDRKIMTFDLVETMARVRELSRRVRGNAAR